MKIEIYQIGKATPLTVVECSDWNITNEGIPKLRIIKNGIVVAIFLTNNIAGFRCINEDNKPKEATTEEAKCCSWCHDNRGNKRLNFNVTDTMEESIHSRFINYCPFCGRKLRKGNA